MTTTMHREVHAANEIRDVVVQLDDESLPTGLTELRQVVRHAFLDGTTCVIVDISGLQRLTSGTVAALLWAKRHCQQRGGTVVLRAPGESSLGLLRRTGLGDVLHVEIVAADAGSTT